MKLIDLKSKRAESVAEVVNPFSEQFASGNVKACAIIWEDEDGEIKISHYGDNYKTLGMATALEHVIMQEIYDE